MTTDHDTDTTDLAKKIITERALAQVTKAMASVGLAQDDLGELPEAKSNDEIQTAVQDAIDELGEIWVLLRNQEIWLKARRDGLAIATRSA